MSFIFNIIEKNYQHWVVVWHIEIGTGKKAETTLVSNQIWYITSVIFFLHTQGYKHTHTYTCT
jgi:hypothetical protein